LACQWRIKHKLLLGLGLVVGILALMVAGSLKGLASYRATMQSIDSKLYELHELQALLSSLKSAPEASRNPADEPEELRRKMKQAREALARYEERLQETLERRRDTDNGFMEKQLVDALHHWFDKLEEAIGQATAAGQVFALGVQPLHADENIKKAMAELVRAANQLHEEIYGDLYRRITASRADYRMSITLVISTCVAGVALMTLLLRFFYRWTFYPLRDLHAGVGRVAKGQFDQKIVVKSGDEVEDLADAFNDMTGRLHDMYSDLARQVNERSRQLVRSERLASVGYLAAGVAHEINNPLASIAFCGEALDARMGDGRRTLSPEDRETIHKYLKMIQQEAFRCKQITQKLLEFSRGGEKSREPADLGELIQSVLDMVQHLQSAKGKKIVFDGSRTAGRVTAWVNLHELKSVILNLVVNALESMDEDGTLTIVLRLKNGMAEMLFSDTGCGMNAEVLDNIFEPFFTRSRTGKGTGLGLSISHRIVSQHHGEIEATSGGPGQGSTFTVRLPLEPADVASDDAPLRLAA
jgi:signal transduction histidine kinase